MSSGFVMPRASRGAIARRACAKINLDLRILATRPDGYHELSTVFQTISVFDAVRVEPIDPAEPLRLTCSDPAVPADSRNLAWRAAAALWEAIGGGGEPRGVAITLEKGIPSQGGLGGGSADAAVVLSALNDLWGAPVDDGRLARLAAGLGADVLFFLLGGTARATGRGDMLEPWPDLPPHAVVLVQPTFGVATADAYKWYDESPRPAAGPLQETGKGGADWLAVCRNDLEEPVVGRHPELLPVLTALRGQGAEPALLSGSGSTVFGLFADAGAADAAVRACAMAGARIFRASTVTRAQYVEAALGGRAHDVSLPRASTIV
jgi:4-diphosphocytidyl-2-C-methyl-D-erythritol kinase